jgi:hypothetical protein
MPNVIREFFDLPEQVRKGDFVLKLSEGVEHAEETARSYVATPGLVAAFGKALGLVKASLHDGRSRAHYVYGSFGSGKSHFMAMMSLLFDNVEAAWRLPEFHEMRASHDWVGKAKLLQLRFHMLGQDSLEAAVLGEYVRFVRRTHPTAPVPAVFADEALFADAERLRRQLGDDKFFGPLNTGADAEGDGWGDMAMTWGPERFAEALRSPEPKVRADLFNALVKTHFQAFALQKHSFVDIDSGLATLTRHAKTLGYDGVVFFLDELVLWLAAGAANAPWLHAEVPKLGKLVEAQDAHRDVPIISYIARQRDLAELVGEQYAGTENAILRNTLSWWKGRIEDISLEDRNLPAIAEKRVLRPKNEAAKKRLDDAFEALKRAAGASWPTLLGQADGAAFRKLYPFSPALVDTLVALSNSLQRERTAIKLLMELLVEHVGDLELGQLVPVGDLFDVLAGGDDTADGLMKARFESAKHLYKSQLLPMLQEAHGTKTEARCQRLRPHHPTRIGCSGCPEKACRNDNRLVKTLLIAALVPEVPALKDLTASRLVQLNHGTLKTPIPGTEAKIAVQRLRDWASRVGQIHLSPQDDPTIRVQLEGVDLGPILEQAADHDNVGRRQQLLRDLLFERLGLDSKSPAEVEHYVWWRETKRKGHVRFGNVRRMTAEQLRCPDGYDWRLVIDYPFDDPGFGPKDDEVVIDKVRDEGSGTWTLVWLPSFFSESTNRLVREVVILDHILETREITQRYLQHLSVEQQQRAAGDLRNLREQKRAQLGRILDQAYGLATRSERDIDASRSIDEHLFVLKPGAKVQPSLASTFEQALENYIAGLLEARWPRHPSFTSKLSNKKVAARVLEVFGQLIDVDEKKLAADRDTLDVMKGTLGQLNLVRTTETALHFVEDGLVQELERKRQQRGVPTPKAYEVASWVDEASRMGLEPEALDVVIRAYARATARTLARGGKAYVAPPGSPLPDDVELERPELPSPAAWARALELAGDLFGVALAGRAIHGDNLRRFADQVNKVVKDSAQPCNQLLAALEQRCHALGVDKGCDRLVSAGSANTLCSTLMGQPAVAQVHFLANFTPHTSARAVGTSIKSASEVFGVLDNSLVFGIFAQYARLPGPTPLLDEVRKALRQDELFSKLADTLRKLAEGAQEELAKRQKVPDPIGNKGPGPEPGPGQIMRNAEGRRDVLEALRQLVAEVEARGEGEAVTLVATLSFGKGLR